MRECYSPPALKFSDFQISFNTYTVGNTNAPEAVTYSAIIYCLRCLISEDIPLNQGCLKPVEVKIPKGSFLSPSGKAAVVGGNVLTVSAPDVVMFTPRPLCV